MIRFGLFLCLLGFGSAIMHFTDVQFRLLVWSDPYQPVLGLALGGAGALLLVVRIMFSKEEPAQEQPPAGHQQAYGQPAGPPAFGPPSGPQPVAPGPQAGPPVGPPVGQSSGQQAYGQPQPYGQAAAMPQQYGPPQAYPQSPNGSPPASFGPQGPQQQFGPRG